LIPDNHSAHISKETKAWLTTHPTGRFEFTFTPTHGSWLNLMAEPSPTSLMLVATSIASLLTSTTMSACTRRSETNRHLNSKPRSRETKNDNVPWNRIGTGSIRVSFVGGHSSGYVVVKTIRGWAEANDYIACNSPSAAEAPQRIHYRQASLTDVAMVLKGLEDVQLPRMERLYSHGSVVKWLQQANDSFTGDAGVPQMRSK
jgi:hypothetical protein